jgi:hypothetical protein
MPGYVAYYLHGRGICEDGDLAVKLYLLNETALRVLYKN